ncbi:MAG: ketoacyl-synthetase C-terminal extension domain-containing protein, partial [Exilibacterium sp.]
MQHRQLAPSLHSQQLNPDIPFVKTPFKVQQTLEEWQPPQLERDGRVIDCPRRAGISSFGAGGANAHLILEEYLPVEGSGINREQPALILLSAKTEPQLQAQVENLLAAIEANGFTDKDLPDIAYTLQIGREAMAERLALIADSIASMVDKLTAFLTAESSVDGFCRGRADKNKNEKQGPGFFGVENESRPRILLRTAALWVKGAVFDWQGLYAGREPRRIRLPGYPFARETHWIT